MTTESSIAKTGIFWNIEDCPIPEGLNPRNILENIKSSLTNEGYVHGEVSVRAYCEKKNWSFDDLSLADITFEHAHAGNHLKRFRKILEDILFFTVQNRVRYPQTIHKIVLISKIPQDDEIATILQVLVTAGYIVLLAVPDALEYVSSVWLWPSLTVKVNPIHQSGSSLLEGVASKGKKIHANIDDFIFCYSHYGMTLQKKDYYMEVDKMLVDIVLWALDNPAPSNLLVISKDISEETKSLLQALESKDYNILFAQLEEAPSAVLRCTERPKCLLKVPKSLFGGGNPIDQRGSAQGVPNHGKLTGIFWNIEDCPIPEGYNPRNILENIKSSLAEEGYHGEVSVWAYCGQTSIFRELWSDYNHANIILRTSVGEGIVEVNHMIVDILSFGMRNPAPSNVLVISKEVSGEFFNRLQELKSENFNILVVQPDEIESEALLDIVSMDWRWPKQSDIDKESDEVMSDS
ncbi:unnamed protein product [Arabis nemorensis]|uniref:NYN domain-containing protein n=1 Tax=Arabis nemorensis TaxID=586526 RepID=A0A565BWV4_9BRAS|nr:unnamed protein product [Arabis nemorensis]